jgi:NAD kinase
MYEKIVVVTRRTRLEELIERFNTRAQAQFYIEHSGGDFSDYDREHSAYHLALSRLKDLSKIGLKIQFIARDFLANFIFTDADLIVAIGQDGLVANVAKYANGQPIVGINPDPARFDGILVPFAADQATAAVQAVIEERAAVRAVTMAEADLGDGQRLLAFNDLFIGARTHVSARYSIEYMGRSEHHSSSGIIVSTGAGSTGWLSSVFNMASGIAAFTGHEAIAPARMSWEEPRLMFVVREPFVSKHSSAGIVAGTVGSGEELILQSLMPSGGVIFSDGVEQDFLEFNSGAVATVRLAEQQARLAVPGRGGVRDR